MAGKFVAEYPDGPALGLERKQHADGGGFSGAVLPGEIRIHLPALR